MPTKTKQLNNIPHLRFPGFSGAWEEKKFDDVFISIGTKNYQIKNSEILSDGLYKVVDQGKDLIAGYSNNSSKIFSNIPVIIFGDHTTILKYIDFQFVVGADGTKILDLKNEKDNLKFLYFKLLFNPVKTEGYKRHFNILRKRKILLPTPTEQQKIADFLGTVDAWIEKLKAQKQSLDAYKKGLMQKIFSREIRFKSEKEKDFPEWEEKKLGDCLDYEQPTEYIVNSTEYDPKNGTPVLTAGKTFILGYTDEKHGIFEAKRLPVIIFDDFTTTSQFVTFPFKVKSSAMKILKNKIGTNIKFMYEAMQLIKYEIGGHGRHWISKYSVMDILVPSLPEQEKIADFITSLDDLINLKQQQITRAEEWKRGVMRGVFV